MALPDLLAGKSPWGINSATFLASPKGLGSLPSLPHLIMLNKNVTGSTEDLWVQ